jgi:glycosyltransferase involved in cell wall biosynthesis
MHGTLSRGHRDEVAGTAVGEVLVSVSVTTYNHAPYITQAVESVLAQEVDFPVEIIIGDDCSTDGTREILRDLQLRHPGRIRLVLPERNLGDGGLPMFMRTLEGVRGRYVAMLDGDDYWTAPGKLRTQVSYLEEHPDCSMCFHEVLEVTDDGSRPPRLRNPEPLPERLTLRDALGSCFVGACAPMFRREILDPLPAWYAQMPFGDWPLYIIAAERGYLGYIPQPMGVYRLHGDGAWAGLDRRVQLERLVEFYRRLDAATEHRHAAGVRPALARCYYKLALELNRRGDGRAAFGALWRMLRLSPLGGDLDRGLLLREMTHGSLSRLRARMGRSGG